MVSRIYGKRLNEYIKLFDAELVDLERINKAALLFESRDIIPIIERFGEKKVETKGLSNTHLKNSNGIKPGYKRATALICPGSGNWFTHSQGV